MITIEQYDITQFSMRKAWKAEFREFLNNNYNTSFVNANDVFKSIPNVDKFIKKNNLGDKILHIKDIGIVDNIKRTMLEHRKFGMGATVSTNDFKIILLDNYIDFLKSKSNVTTALVNTEEQQIDKEQKTTEGMIKEVKYFRSQRNRAIRDQCAKRDNYTCQVCGFNFEKVYGERGKRFIEVHHKNPMANFDEEHEVKLEDLISLCSNCHSMVHYGGEFLDIDDLRNTLTSSKD